MLGSSVAGKRISVIGTGNMGGAFSEALSRISGIDLCLRCSNQSIDAHSSKALRALSISFESLITSSSE